jgi:hypothetical protein
MIGKLVVAACALVASVTSTRLVLAAETAPATKDPVQIALPADRLAKLRDPISDLPHTPSPLAPDRKDWVCQYGNLRMMTYIGEPDPAKLAENLKRFNVTFATHSAGAVAISFCNRYKTVDEMRANSLERRPQYKVYHDASVIALPYIDYQRCQRKPDSQTYENWDKIRKEWEFVFGPLPEDINDVIELDVKGQPANKYTFCPDSPWTLMRAFFCMALDTNNGGDGNYFDNQYYATKGCFCPRTTAAFQKWLGEQFTPEKRRDLFGTEDVTQLSPSKAVATREGTPLHVAWQRYRAWKMGWMREQIMAFGRSMNPRYAAMSTYYSHAGAPFDPIVGSAIDIEQMTKGGNRDTMLFWEPGTTGPVAGESEAAAKAAAERDGKKDYRFGRRSFSCSLKQMVGASFVPVVSKQEPPKTPICESLTELCMAESYANLVTPRTGMNAPYNAEAIERMHSLQVAHPELFVGAKPYGRVALLCSTQQAYAMRRDADATPFSRRLMDIGLEHQVIPDRCLTPEGLAPFDLLFVYDAALLSDAQLMALDEFRKRGTLVVIGPCGTHDEWNRPRQGGAAQILGDLPSKAAGTAPAISADKHVVYVPPGAITKWHGDYWYRHSDDGDMSGVRTSVEMTFGKAWPYLASQQETCEIHLAQIADKSRTLAHVVNYNVSADGKVTATRDMELAVRLYGDIAPTKAFFATPELGKEVKPLAVRVEQRQGAKYALVQVPPVHVYGVVAIE